MENTPDPVMEIAVSRFLKDSSPEDQQTFATILRNNQKLVRGLIAGALTNIMLDLCMSSGREQVIEVDDFIVALLNQINKATPTTTQS